MPAVSPVERMQQVAAKHTLTNRESQRRAAAENTAMSQFEQDFRLVAEHYELEKTGEYELALDLAKRDKENARICYHSIAETLRGNNSATGINERICARNEADRKAAA